MLEQIAIQKKRQFEYKNSRKDRGKLLMDIRAALQSMVAMLVCVRRGGKLIKKQTRDTDKKITTTKEEDEMDEQEDHISRIDIPMITVDTEGEEFRINFIYSSYRSTLSPFISLSHRRPRSGVIIDCKPKGRSAIWNEQLRI